MYNGGKGGKVMEKPSIAMNTGGGVTNLKGDKDLHLMSQCWSPKLH